MGYTRLIIYIVGLLLVVAAAWIFLTQTPFAEEIPAGVALAIILLLVGLGIMVSASAMDDTFYARRRYVHEAEPFDARRPPEYGPRGSETYVEERRY